MRAHSNEDIIRKAMQVEKPEIEVRDNKIDIVVDMDDSADERHSYVVTFSREGGGSDWSVSDVSELSSL